MPQLLTTPLRVAFHRPWPTTRRGFKLWLIALILGMKGIGYLLGTGTASTDLALQLFVKSVLRLVPGPLDHVLPISTRIVGLCIVGMCAFAAVTAYCHHGRDRWGYNLVAAVAVGWVSVFLTAPLSGAPWSSVQGALSYALVYLLIIYSAKDPDEPAAAVQQCAPRRRRLRARWWRR